LKVPSPRVLNVLFQDTQKRDGPKDQTDGSTCTGLNNLISTKLDANYILSNEIVQGYIRILQDDAKYVLCNLQSLLDHIQSLYDFERRTISTILPR